MNSPTQTNHFFEKKITHAELESDFYVNIGSPTVYLNISGGKIVKFKNKLKKVSLPLPSLKKNK